MCSKEDLRATEDTIRQWLVVEDGRVVVRDGVLAHESNKTRIETWP